MTRFWICYRQQDGRKCLTRNQAVKKKCVMCGAPKPAPRRPKHLAALEIPYETYVEINGGDRCAICDRPRSEMDRRRLDRDHDHRTGLPRGLLCHKCNRALPSWVTPEWLDAAAAYLRRAVEGGPSLAH